MERNILEESAWLAGCVLLLQVRKGYNDGSDNTHAWIANAAQWGVCAATLHGRTRQQRCAAPRSGLPIFYFHLFPYTHASFQTFLWQCGSPQLHATPLNPRS